MFVLMIMIMIFMSLVGTKPNEILGASADFGELGLNFFSNKLFLSSYVYYFKD